MPLEVYKLKFEGSCKKKGQLQCYHLTQTTSQWVVVR